MSGSFAIGLIEILAYLFPGGLVLASVLFIYLPSLGSNTLKEATYQAAFIACSYIIGHVLTFISYPYTKLRTILRKADMFSPPEIRLPFYKHLLPKLQSLFDSDVEGDAAYHFSARLIADKKLAASQVADRYYALTLFSRNISASFIVAAILLLQDNLVVAIVSGGLAVVFLFRYIQLERIMNDTVFRAAYVYLCSRQGGEAFEQKESENA